MLGVSLGATSVGVAGSVGAGKVGVLVKEPGSVVGVLVGGGGKVLVRTQATMSATLRRPS